MNKEKFISIFKEYSRRHSGGFSQETKLRVKERLLEAIKLQEAKPVFQLKPALGNTFSLTRLTVVCVVVLALLTGTAYGSSVAIPGDTLYPFKRAVENTSYKLAPTSELKTKLQVKFTTERLNELDKVEKQSHSSLKIPAMDATVNQNVEDKTQTATVKIQADLESNIQTNAELEDKTLEEVNNALNSLKNTEQSLRSKKGKIKEAENLASAIIQLTNRASHHREKKGQKRQETNIKSENKKEVKEEKDGKRKENREEKEKGSEILKINLP